MDISKICCLVDASQVVSFDIFDTLIVRLYKKPIDLFAHLEESTHSPGFQAARIAAEQEARKRAAERGVHEVTLDEIYAQLHQSYQPMKQKEISLERVMCRANPEMRRVFDYALERGKPIYIASDMYLPRDVIEMILSDAGYRGYVALLLSSETRRPKATGEMYEDLITAAGTRQILHIGDHPFTDGQAAREKGLQTFYYEPLWQTAGGNQNSAYFAILNQYVAQNPVLSILEGMTVLHAASQPAHTYWEAFGYKYIGILAYGYMKWLKERLNHLGISKIYFMLRDVFLMKQVFDQMFPGFETYEIYGSRRMFLFAGMRTYRDVQLHITGIHTKGITYARFWERLSLESEAFHRRYLEAFPVQEQKISSEEQLRELDTFMEENEAFLLEAGREERALLEEYFQQSGLLDGPAAVVDLGWKGSMLKGLENICNLLDRPANLTGFYLGTHTCNTPNLRMESYLLDHGHTTGAKNADTLLDGYIIQILEFSFSAPHQSILKLRRQAGELLPVYQDSGVYEENRCEMCRQIIDGVMAFTRDMMEIEQTFPLSISRETALAPVEYLSKSASKSDQVEIQKQKTYPGIGNDSSSRPVLKHGWPLVGVINPWPGSMSAESEVVARLRRTLEENQMACVVMDNVGRILDEKQERSGQYARAEDITFVITTHYETPKVLNSFYYHTVWNPPEIPLNVEYYNKDLTNHYMMNDDFLIFDTGGMSNHLRGILMNCPRTLEGASLMTTSFPASSILPPNLSSPTMFYCGMNWEKVVHGTNRHQGLFKLLDRTRKAKFYGPEIVDSWGGLRPWEGYQCYQYSIPFDGFSILKEINQCGICLVLSSDIHRRAGAATTRLYEACAAGAVIISDDNEFTMKNFRDAALFIIYNKNNPQDTFRQIMEKYDWVVSHPEEALTLAKRAQQIFLEHFTLDLQIQQIVENHPQRFAQIAEDLYAKDSVEKVLVTYVLNTQSAEVAKPLLERVFQNIHGQLYQNIELVVAADEPICDALQAYCDTRCACARVIAMELFDKKGSRRLTDGQAIRQLQKEIPHTFYVNSNAEEIWFFDHITSLVRCLQNTGELCAYSGSSFQNAAGERRINCFESVQIEHLFDRSMPGQSLMSGQFLFSEAAHELLPDFLFDCLDGDEHYAYANIIHYKYGHKLIFSRRMSFCFTQAKMDERNTVLPKVMQIRFVQDLVRLDLPEQRRTAAVANLPSAPVTKRSVAEILLLMPLKSYIRIRYYRIRMRRLTPGSKKHETLQRKYNQILEQYNEFWGNE